MRAGIRLGTAHDAYRKAPTLDDTAGALEWVERSADLGMINYPYLNEYDPILAPLRGEPRFQRLMERVKHAWETFEG